tara:strand:+ start:227 stop:430 length:204 start_codon:yes stop_codon:yes gene_type:complete
MQIIVKDYPQLHMLCWNRSDNALLDEDEALALYERNWRFIDQETVTVRERALINVLAKKHGGLLVAA